jgi:hypothetical protein
MLIDKNAIEPVYELQVSAENMFLEMVNVQISIENHIFDQQCKLCIELYPEPNIGITTQTDLANTLLPNNFGEHIKGKIIPQNVELVFVDATFTVPQNKLTCRWRVNEGSFLHGNDHTLLERVIFHLINFSNIHSDKIIMITRENTQSSARVFSLMYGDWEITIHEVHDSHEVFETLAKRSGYGMTHVGLIQRKDKNEFSVNEAHKLLSMLDVYLSFTKGIPCATVCPVGFHTNEIVWKSITLPNYPWKLIQNWSSHQKICRTKPVFEVYFPLFCQLLNDEKWNDVITSIIDFYIYSHMVPVTKIEVVMVQAAFERIAYAFIVENNKILSAEPYRKLQPETEKVRMFLRLLDIEVETPKEILNYLDKSMQTKDIVQLMFDMRNSTLHPVNKLKGNITELEHEVALYSRQLLEMVIETLIGAKGLLHESLQTERVYIEEILTRINQNTMNADDTNNNSSKKIDNKL